METAGYAAVNTQRDRPAALKGTPGSDRFLDEVKLNLDCAIKETSELGEQLGGISDRIFGSEPSTGDDGIVRGVGVNTVEACVVHEVRGRLAHLSGRISAIRREVNRLRNL